MGKFFAWAATGIVTGLQVWPQTPQGRGTQQYRGQTANAAPPGPGQRLDQRFFLRQNDGREIEILLTGTPMSIRNGHAITAVWAAQAKAPYGHCIYLENQTSGAIARLVNNLTFIRRQMPGWKVAAIGFLLPLPFIAAIVAWLLHRNPSGVEDQAFLMSSSLAVILLLIIGFVSSKLFFDYIKAEDERQIWIAADKALSQARMLLIQRGRTPQRSGLQQRLNQQ
jgi:hypothetical protein